MVRPRVFTARHVPTFARSGSGKWHVVGPDGCRYGRAFDDGDGTPDETVTATDVVAYDPPDTDERSSSSVSVTMALGGSSFPRGRTDDQRIVLPTAVEDSDSDLCGSCRSELEAQQRRRSRVIVGLKRVTPVRPDDWSVIDRERRRACDWCRTRESTTWHSDDLRTEVCPACGRLFGTDLGEPAPDDRPDRDWLPATPSGSVAPIVFGITLPDEDPTEMVGSNRPLLKYREKHKYAELVCELERTGHGFDADGLAAIDAVATEYARRVADDESHQTEVGISIGRTPRTVTIEGLFPDDAESVIADLWPVVADPANWFPLGWPDQGAIYHHSGVPSIPGDDSVVETFPRLRTRDPSRSVDTESIRRITDPGRYERGQRYYRRGAVTGLELVGDHLEATVQGSRPYDVEVTFSEGSYAGGRCSCPDDAVPCKHVVAAVLATGDVDGTPEDRPLEEVLAAAPPEELRRLLREAAEEDVGLRRRIHEELGGS